MLELEKQRCIVSNVNPRAEKHGDDRVIACDINLKTTISADVLNSFSPGLKEALYERPERSKQAALISGDEEAIEGPALRFDGVLDSVQIKKEYIGYGTRIVWGDLAGSVDIVIGDCKVCKISAKLMPGGSCELSFQVQSRPSAQQMGELCELIQGEVVVTLDAPSADAEPGDADS